MLDDDPGWAIRPRHLPALLIPQVSIGRARRAVTRFFLRAGFANAAALFGLVGYFLTTSYWPYAVGFVLTVLGLRRAAPTRSNLRDDQYRLQQSRCGRNLTRALRGSP